jgi:glycerol-3-phosphate cytidylyltransferase
MKTVLTYGTFDMLHYGHLEILRRAKEHGDRLIVGLSTDEFNNEKEKQSHLSYDKRKELLEALEYVDLVIPENTWEQKTQDVLKNQVDIFIMGDDWKGKFDFLKDYCEVLYLPRTDGISSTKLKSILQK